MKKFNYLLITLLLTISFTSCEKDEEDTSEDAIVAFKGEVSESDLEGQWEMVDYQTKNGKTTTKFDENTLVVNYTQEGSNFDYILDISTEPNLMSGSGSYDIRTDSEINGVKSSETTKGDTALYDPSLLTLEWELATDNRILFDQDGTAVAYTIVDISETKLVLAYDLNEVSANTDILGDSSPEYSIKIEGITFLTFTKL